MKLKIKILSFAVGMAFLLNLSLPVANANAAEINIPQLISIFVALDLIDEEQAAIILAILESANSQTNDNVVVEDDKDDVVVEDDYQDPEIYRISLDDDEYEKGDRVEVTWKRSGDFSGNNYYFVYLKDRFEQLLGNNNPSRPVTYSPLVFREKSLDYPEFDFRIPSSYEEGFYYIEIDYANSSGIPITSITSDRFGVFDEEPQSEPISIDVDYGMYGYDGDYKQYVLSLSGGSSANPVKLWQLNADCPSNVSEVIAKVHGNLCDGENYVLGSSDISGDLDIDLDIIHDDWNTANLEIRIRAFGSDDTEIDDIEFVLPVHKG